MDSVTQYIMGWNTPAVICLVVGMVLMAIEIFTPGMGAPAIFGSVALVAAIILRADSVETALVTFVLILAPLLIAGGIAIHSFSKGALSRSPVVLKEKIDGSSTSLSDAEMQALVGREGVALTALRPAGNGDFGGRRLDVVSCGEFIAKGSAIRITAVEGLRIMVEQV
ncbi:MAG: NfeD family protein [Christensenellales bacterium]